LTLDETYPSMRPINDGPRAAPERLQHTTEPLLSAPNCSARYRSVHGLHQPSPTRADAQVKAGARAACVEGTCPPHREGSLCLHSMYVSDVPQG